MAYKILMIAHVAEPGFGVSWRYFMKPIEMPMPPTTGDVISVKVGSAFAYTTIREVRWSEALDSYVAVLHSRTPEMPKTDVFAADPNWKEVDAQSAQQK